jgi:uncharacterized protein (TIGR02996 family)
MHSDDGFLRAILANPADDTARLVYADWLDEQGDDASRLKAEFLRETVELSGAGKTLRPRIVNKMRRLASQLDTNWLVVVSRLRIENCAGKRALGEWAFEFVCDKRWDDLQPTTDRAVRFCATCQNNVHYCDTIMEARRHAWAGHCIAVDLGIIRRDRDLEPAAAVAGMPSADFWQQEAERMAADPVSEGRERRKREARPDQPGE